MKPVLLSETKPADSAARPVYAALSSAGRQGTSGRAAQPASNRLQASTAPCSIAEVDSWLKANAAAAASSVEAMRIKDVVNALKRKPSPRKKDIQPFFHMWGVKQKKRLLSECIQELSTKVVEAAGSLQTDLPSVASCAEQPGTSSGVLLFDINLVNQRRLNLQRSIFFPEVNAKKAPTPVHSKAFRLLQDCQKYLDNHFLMDEDDQTKLGKIIRELEIESQPQCSREMCRELYKLTNVKQILGPFTYKAKTGCQEELDHNEVRYTAFLASTREDLMAFLSGRDALPAELYPHIADLVVDWEESKSVVDMGAPIRVIRKSWLNVYTEGLLEILKPMLVTEDLFLLPDYAENEWLYRLIAAERDQAAGITIEGPWDLEVWETEGLKGDIEKIRKDMEIQGLLGRAELLEKEIETCRRKDEARRKWLGMETLVQLKEVQRDGCSSIEEHEVQIKELMALKKECRTRWREQGKGDDECARLWSAYCLLVMRACVLL